MTDQTQNLFNAVIVSDDEVISLAQLCRRCALSAEQLIPMIDYGIIEPLPGSRRHIHLQFSAECVPRMQTALRLQRDLEINLAGTALALELLDEVKNLRQLVAALQRD
jgi:chaperone modulatory protein CbpM